MDGGDIEAEVIRSTHKEDVKKPIRYKFQQLNLEAFVRPGDFKYWVVWRTWHRIYFPFVVILDTWTCSKLFFDLLDVDASNIQYALPVAYITVILIRLYLDWYEI